MKRNLSLLINTVLIVAFTVVLGFSQTQAFQVTRPILQGDPGEYWFDRGWDYRIEVTISNPCGAEVAGYQVKITLDNTFAFGNAMSDGSDVRITSVDGITPIPFWIEDWDSTGETASIWVKIPIIPSSGTSVYLYYGNLSPPVPGLVESPPIGPWVKTAGNPIIPAGDPGDDGISLLAENMVYDDVTEHYWLVFADYSQGGVGLSWSDDPIDPSSWTYSTRPVTSGNAPHLIHHAGTWYLFYSLLPNIMVATASAVDGPYTIDPTPVLTVSEPWEAYRVDEPFVFQRNDGTWILIYMGDEGSTTERIGYAEASAITGPYTKYASNPVIDFGPPGSIDAGTVADPWVVEFHGTYYIGYTVSPTKSSPWRTSYVTTHDWLTFTKSNEIILDVGPGGAWDAANAFRGAVTRIGDTYVFSYTGDSYQMGIATQPVYLPVNQEDQVFPFYDEFNDGVVDTSTKWVLGNGSASQLDETGGILTLTGLGAHVRIHGTTSFGMNYLVEAYGRHPNAGTNQMIPEVGFAETTLGNTVRLANDFHTTTYWERQAKRSSEPDNWNNMSQTVDTNWHLLRIYRLLPEVAGFQIDNNPVETYASGDGTTNVPTGNIPAFLMSFGNGNELKVDWIRVRRYCGADATATLGTEEPRPLVAGISISKTSDSPVLSGSTVNFDITVTNDGDYDLSSVVISDALAPACDLIIPTFLIGAEQTYPCSLANVTEDFTNAIIVNAVPDVIGGNVSDIATTFVDVDHPSIAISKSPDDQYVIEGIETAAFTITITNTGDVTLDNIIVSDTLVPDCDRAIGSLDALETSSYNCSISGISSSFINNAIVTSDGPYDTHPTDTESAAVTYRSLDEAGWMDSAWGQRKPVLVTCPCSEPESDYQVQVLLNNSNFNFEEAETDGSDLRVTSIDGVTQIPFWIEDWNDISDEATIWIKVPELPLSGTVVYLYFDNPAPTFPPPVETPPIGPWIRAVNNPIIPSGGPTNGHSLLAENIVYDSVSSHYWMVHANYNDGGVGLVWSDTPTDPTSWVWDGTVITAANAPHIMEHGGTWYLFYADKARTAANMPGYTGAYPGSRPISVLTAPAVDGPYTDAGIMLASTAPWEATRVDEPYVLWSDTLSKWIMMYMGDAASAVEQVSYATADNILGPYSKYDDGATPFIPFGPSGSYDAGTVADPWVVKFYGTYYIGYTVSPTSSSPWQTAYATTTDWVTLTKHGITLPLGPPGEWDAANSFRGAVTRIDDTYVFAYTGDSYQMGIATQEVFQQESINDPSVVFPFFDDFDDDSFDTNKWGIAYGDASQINESGELITLTGLSDYIKIYGLTAVGMDFMVEAYAQHPDAGTMEMISEMGMAGFGFENTVRIADYFHYEGSGPHYWERQAKIPSTSGDPWTYMAQEADANWHTFRTYRLSPNIAGFQIDDTTVETTTTDVPTNDLPAFLMSYGNGNQFIVDWIRIRKWCGTEALTEVKDVQYPTAVTISTFNANPGVGRIQLEWQTAIEVNLLGFNLYRSTSLTGDREQLNQNVIQSASPGDILGADYEYIDTQVQPGIHYYYWLEAVPVTGPPQLLGPVEATLLHENYLPLMIQR